jgi:hypothetical protein
MKVFIVIAIAAILVALASAGLFMLRDGRDGKPKTSKMARALALRVGLSVLLFICILLSYRLGWIQPTGIPAGS